MSKFEIFLVVQLICTALCGLAFGRIGLLGSLAGTAICFFLIY